MCPRCRWQPEPPRSKPLGSFVLVRSRRLVLLLAVLAAVGAAGYAYLRARPTTAPLDPSLATPPAEVSLSPAETAFFAYVAPRLHALAVETHALADLGRRKS